MNFMKQSRSSNIKEKHFHLYPRRIKLKQSSERPVKERHSTVSKVLPRVLIILSNDIETNPGPFFSYEEYIPPDKGEVHLMTTDYTLNSPIICDDMTAWYDYKNSGNLSKRFERFRTDLNAWLSYCPVIKKRTIDEIIRIGGRIILKGGPLLEPVENFDNILKKSEDVQGILKTYWKKIVGEDINFEMNNLLLSLSPRFKNYLGGFFCLHKLILYLNARSEDRVWFHEHDKDFSIKKHRVEGKSVYGRWTLFGSIIYFIDLDFAVNKELLLSWKDTLVARFCTGLSSILRNDGRYGQTFANKVLEIYDLGDEILSEHGNEGFSSIKLLEPLCNQRMVELAGDVRPQIPRFNVLRNHLNNWFSKNLPGSYQMSNIKRIIDSLLVPHEVMGVYGLYRHWGHPNIDYLRGLAKMKERTQMCTDHLINEDYVNSLSSDLARHILTKKYREKKKWFVDDKKLSAGHPLYQFVRDNTWPDSHHIDQIGDTWHHLPLTACFDLPDSLDPSIMYADKSHSINRSEIIEHILTRPNRPIPSRKVLNSVLENSATDIKKFLTDVNEQGLDSDDLAIGLKAKERELKIEGRFFSLMTRRLREYFVITEYLIKEDILPMFQFITMADDMPTLTKKMMDGTAGQGSGYETVGISNHIDYEKWNNYQRYKSTAPVFKVLGQFYGLPNLFSRTHEFFEKSLFYYNDRPDLMNVIGGKVYSSHDAAWEGQLGGVEGLRQKGWCLLNMLVEHRESRERNTLVRILAQGDNQIITTLYKVSGPLASSLRDIVRNNDSLMKAVETGIKKLGLFLNMDEMMQSADYMNYGKVPYFAGNLIQAEFKRWSRVTCLDNDQIPTFSSLMSSVSTNALTVAQFHDSHLDPMRLFCIFSCFCMSVISYYSPLLKRSFPNPTKETLVRMIFLDPSLGGISGTCLNRFIIRAFPDPVTESLSFWKLMQGTIYEEYAREAGNPVIIDFTQEHLSKLLEDPTSLNLRQGMSASYLVRQKIRMSLARNAHDFKNDLFRNAFITMDEDRNAVLSFLNSIEPKFPRFMSAFADATYSGITESLAALFQNSRTIRSQFSHSMPLEINRMMIKSEEFALRLLFFGRQKGEMWECSSTWADSMRNKSWGKVVGVTIPHPCEMLEMFERTSPHECQLRPNGYIATIYPDPLSRGFEVRGNVIAYLGSSTRSGSFLMNPWEKDSKDPLLRRAMKLRESICWFIKSGSNLSKSIFNNLFSLTGVDWTEVPEGFTRTGNPYHRFSTSKQSNGGYSGIGPNLLTYVVTTTDKLRLPFNNDYDFMYQACIIWSQTFSVEANLNSNSTKYHHFHLKCKKCLRPVRDLTLDSHYVASLPPRSEFLINMGLDVNIIKKTISPDLKTLDWSRMSNIGKSFYIGKFQALHFGILESCGSSSASDHSIFPVGQTEMEGLAYLAGIYQGVEQISAYNTSCSRYGYIKPIETWNKRILDGLYNICRNTGFIRECMTGNVFIEIFTRCYRPSPNYPSKTTDDIRVVEQYFSKTAHILKTFSKTFGKTLIFNDAQVPSMKCLLVASHAMHRALSKYNTNSISTLRAMNKYVSEIMTGKSDQEIVDPNVYLLPKEVRHARLELTSRKHISIPEDIIYNEYIGQMEFVQVRYSSSSGSYPKIPSQIDCPLISGLRPLQLSTGAHYKIRSIIHHLGIVVSYFLSFGDGSGGITSCLLRYFPGCVGVFNSLLDSSGCAFHGMMPRGPNAISQFGPQLTQRCINFENCAEEPSDVSDELFWKHVIQEYNREKKFDLVIGDCEVQSLSSEKKIIKLLQHYLPKILEERGTFIIKTYGTRIHNNHLLEDLGSMFKNVRLCVSEFTSSHSSELYLVCSGRKSRNFKIPDDHTMEKLTSLIKANKTNREELDRARGIDVTSAKGGIPESFVPSNEMMITALLKSIGFSPGLSASISSQTIQFKNPPFSFLVIVSNFLINTTGWRRRKPFLPSNRRLVNHLSIYLGVLYTLALNQNNMNHYEHAMQLNNNPVDYFYYTESEIRRPMKIGSTDLYYSSFSPPNNWCPGTEKKVCKECNGIAFSTMKDICYQCSTGLRAPAEDFHDGCKKCKLTDHSKVELWKMAWSFCGEGPSKRVEKPNNALIGSVIRAFSGLNVGKTIDIDSDLHSVNRNLNLDFIRRTTGLTGGGGLVDESWLEEFNDQIFEPRDILLNSAEVHSSS